MRLHRRIIYLVVMLCFTSAVAAQAAACGAMVQQALDDVQQGCAATGRNQACYGNVSLEASPRNGVLNFTFDKAGDLANVADIDSLHLSALDSADNTWGIALMKLQANLPDTLPGQNVTFLLFGDVQIQNAVSAPGATVQLMTKSSANIRVSPSTSSLILGSAAVGETLTADGRNADSSWLHVKIPDNNALGWIRADLVTPASDVSALNIIDPTQQQTGLTPMQAFYFKTGITQTGCEQAPQDGILIQTPKGVGEINLRANDVDIQLGSTAFLQAQPGDHMIVSVVEGEGHVTAGGVTVDVPEGSQTTIPLDANLHATGAPTDPQRYTQDTVANLPISVLPIPVTIVPPIRGSEEAPTKPAGTATPVFTPTSIVTVQPTIQGTQQASLIFDSTGHARGFTGDLASLNGLTVNEICPEMTSIVHSEEMSLPQYIGVLGTLTNLSPIQKQVIDEFVEILKTCPDE